MDSSPLSSLPFPLNFFAVHTSRLAGFGDPDSRDVFSLLSNVMESEGSLLVVLRALKKYM